MFVVAVTGGIGAGKTEAARWMASRGGAIVLDLDLIAHALLDAPGPVRERLVEAFGPAVLDEGGRIDRDALARAAFADDEATRTLDRIVHPAVLKEVGNGLRDMQLLEAPPRVVVIDVPLLAEAPAFAELADVVLAIEAPTDERVRRCTLRGMAEDDCRTRIARQASDAHRAALADTVIANDGTLEELHAKLEQFWASEVSPHAA